MPTYLVTGGAGFIGSNLVEAILRAGHRAVALDNFATGRRENLEHAPAWASEGGGSFELIEDDIRDPEVCARAVNGVDFVLHQAAFPSVPRSIEDPVSSNEVNISGTLHLLVAARDAGVRRLVFASSSSVYGEIETLPKVESMSPAPISPYALQKLAAETYCRMFHRLYGLETVALRYFNIFGPRQDPTSDYAAVVPKFVRALREGRRPRVFGDGEQSRDFTFVANAVQANLKACEAGPDALGRAYNVGCGARFTLNQLLEQLGELLGLDPDPEYGDPRPGDVRHSLADIGEAERRLGYRPEVDFRSGLQRTLEWF